MFEDFYPPIMFAFLILFPFCFIWCATKHWIFYDKDFKHRDEVGEYKHWSSYNPGKWETFTIDDFKRKRASKRMKISAWFSLAGSCFYVYIFLNFDPSTEWPDLFWVYVLGIAYLCLKPLGSLVKEYQYAWGYKYRVWSKNIEKVEHYYSGKKDGRTKSGYKTGEEPSIWYSFERKIVEEYDYLAKYHKELKILWYLIWVHAYVFVSVHNNASIENIIIGIVFFSLLYIVLKKFIFDILFP